MQLFVTLISGVNPNYNVHILYLSQRSYNAVAKRPTSLVLCDAQNLDVYLVVFLKTVYGHK